MIVAVVRLKRALVIKQAITFLFIYSFVTTQIDDTRLLETWRTTRNGGTLQYINHRKPNLSFPHRP
jgi:hypothetical protein